MTRIRWFKNNEGLLETPIIPLGNNTVQAFIDPSQHPFKASVRLIQDSFNVQELTHSHENINGLKKLVKDQFKLMGVKFDDEVRPRMPKEKETLIKAYNHMKNYNDSRGGLE